MRRKKAQLQVGFNWIYILIAGAVILMFFLLLLIKQKVVSEQKLSATVLRKIEGIFTGAGLSEKTVNIVEVPELTLVFTCDNETDYSDYAVKGTGVKSETPWQPVFAPKEITSKKMITWTLEWKMPFKIINYLLVSAPNIKYFIFSDEYVLPEQFNWDCVGAGCSLKDIGGIKYNNEDQIRLVFPDDTIVRNTLPLEIAQLDDEKVTAVSFSSLSITFYEKIGDSFKPIGKSPLLSSFSIDNPNRYGAIFTTDPDIYKCNLKKSFKRMEMINNIYSGRILDIKNILGVIKPDGFCFGAIGDELIGSTGFFSNMQLLIDSCKNTIEPFCINVKTPAGEIESKNEILNEYDCPVIY